MKNAERLMSGALALGMLASVACSSEVEKTQTKESGIEATVPYQNNEEQALSRVSDMLQLPKLNDLEIRKRYLIRTPTSETEITVLDDLELDESKLQRTIEFLETYVLALGVKDLKIYTPDGQEHITPTLHELSPDANHRMVIVPATFDTTKSVGRAQGSFTYVPSTGETFTIILNEPGNSPALDIPKNVSNISTELCQSISRVRVRDEAVAQYGQHLASVAQEAFCNGFGRALTSAQSGILYDEYSKAYGGKKLSVGELLGEFYLVDEQTYNSIPR